MRHRRGTQPDARWAAVLAGCTLAFVLAVIAASAYIRIGGAEIPPASAASIDAARGVREGAGSIAALGVLALAVATPAVRATRGSLAIASAATLAITAVLSLVGFATGTAPPPWAAYVNQLGGVVLAGLLGWLHGRAAGRIDAGSGERNLAVLALGFCALQAAFGGALATLSLDPPVLLPGLHAASGVAAALCAAALALRLDASFVRIALTLCAALTPSIGVVSTLVPASTGIQVAHALAGALLLGCAAHAAGRLSKAG